jgi:flagellar motor switch protein FliM
MNKILSQEEVNALLRGVETGAVGTDSNETHGGSEILSYDLTSQNRIIRERMPTLDGINERFTRSCQISLSDTLRKTITIRSTAVETLKFGEFMKSVSIPSCINVFKMEPLRGHGLLVIDPQVVYLIVDFLFGGGVQTPAKVEERDFTPLERRIIHKVVSLIFSEFQKAWNPVQAVQIQYQRTEIHPQFASVVTQTEMVVQIAFEIAIESVSGAFVFCFPCTMLDPVRDKLTAGYQSDRDDVDHRWTRHFRNGLAEAPVKLLVELGRGQVKVRDLLHLAPGDVLLLDRRVDEEMDVTVEGNLKFKGHPGVNQGKVALQITSVVRWDEGEKTDGTKRTRRDGGPVGNPAGGGGREAEERKLRKAGGIHAA